MARRLELPPLSTVEELCAAVADRSGRPVRLAPRRMRVGEPSGFVERLADADVIHFEQETSGLHRAHIVCHELAHLLCGHLAEPPAAGRGHGLRRTAHHRRRHDAARPRPLPLRRRRGGGGRGAGRRTAADPGAGARGRDHLAARARAGAPQGPACLTATALGTAAAVSDSTSSTSRIGAAAWTVAGLKLRAWRRDPSSGLLVVALAIAAPASSFLVAAPVVYRLIDRVAHVGNLATLLVYLGITGFSAAAVVLALIWTPPERTRRPRVWDALAAGTRRRVRRRLAVFAVLAAADGGVLRGRRSGQPGDAADLRHHLRARARDRRFPRALPGRVRASP